MIPAARTQCRGIAQSTLHLIGQGDRLNDAFSGCSHRLGDGKDGGDVVGRMRRFLGQVGIVEIEIPHQPSIGKRGQLWKGFVTGSPEGRTSRDRDPLGKLTGEAAGRCLPGTERAAYAVEHPSFDLMDDGLREIFKGQRVAISSEALRKHSDTPPPRVSLHKAVTLELPTFSPVASR